MLDFLYRHVFYWRFPLTPEQERAGRVDLSLDSFVLPGGAWWAWTILFGAGGTLLYMATWLWIPDVGIGHAVKHRVDGLINHELNVSIALFTVVGAMLPMLLVSIGAVLATRSERDAIQYLIHAGTSTILPRRLPPGRAPTFIVKAVRWLLLSSDLLIAKAGGGLAATNLGVALYGETIGTHQPFVVMGCIWITYGLFLYPNVIRAALARRYRMLYGDGNADEKKAGHHGRP